MVSEGDIALVAVPVVPVVPVGVVVAAVGGSATSVVAGGGDVEVVLALFARGRNLRVGGLELLLRKVC